MLNSADAPSTEKLAATPPAARDVQPIAQPVPQRADAPAAVPPRPHSPAIPSGLHGIASSHPYSTAFLIGAALSGSVLAGAAAGRVAMNRIATGAAGGAGSGGSRGLATAAAPPLRNALKPGTGGQVKLPGAAVAAGDVDARLARLETLVREMHINQRGFLDTIVNAQPNISSRLNGIAAALAVQAKEHKKTAEGLNKVRVCVCVCVCAIARSRRESSSFCAVAWS